MIRKRPQLNPSFNKIRALLSSTPNINRGGCAVSAYIMYQALRQYECEDAQIVYGYHMDDHHWECNDTFLCLGSGVASSCSHAYIEVRSLGLSIDCNEIKNEMNPKNLGLVKGLEEFHYVPHELVETFIVSSMIMVEEWNNDFNRKNIPILRFMVETMGVPVPALAKISRNDVRLNH